MQYTKLFILVAGLISTAEQAADHTNSSITKNSTLSDADIGIAPKYPLDEQDTKIPLRILPFGASIVFGVGSTLPSGGSAIGNGFRKPLRDALRSSGWEVDMVGTRHSGDMQDWESEGTPGAIISQGRDYFKRSAPYKPNVILIHMGTNDACGNEKVSQAGNRMRNQLLDMWNSPDMNTTCIILSTLLPSSIPHCETNRLKINAQYRDLVDEFADFSCIYLADMDPISGPAHDWIRPDISTDGIHPNNQGHLKMAYIFWKAILQAADDGRITHAPPIEISAFQPGCGGPDTDSNSSDHAVVNSVLDKAGKIHDPWSDRNCQFANRQGDGPDCCAGAEFRFSFADKDNNSEETQINIEQNDL